MKKLISLVMSMTLLAVSFISLNSVKAQSPIALKTGYYEATITEEHGFNCVAVTEIGYKALAYIASDSAGESLTVSPIGEVALYLYNGFNLKLTKPNFYQTDVLEGDPSTLPEGQSSDFGRLTVVSETTATLETGSVSQQIDCDGGITIELAFFDTTKPTIEPGPFPGNWFMTITSGAEKDKHGSSCLDLNIYNGYFVEDGWRMDKKSETEFEFKTEYGDKSVSITSQSAQSIIGEYKVKSSSSHGSNGCDEVTGFEATLIDNTPLQKEALSRPDVDKTIILKSGTWTESDNEANLLPGSDQTCSVYLPSTYDLTGLVASSDGVVFFGMIRAENGYYVDVGGNYVVEAKSPELAAVELEYKVGNCAYSVTGTLTFKSPAK